MSVVDFGCRLNLVEGAAMRPLVPAGTIVFNTCAVTAEAVRQARQAIRRAKRERPEARIVVTGCAAQIEPESFAAMPEVALVLGNVEKLDAANYLAPAPVPLSPSLSRLRERLGEGVGRVSAPAKTPDSAYPHPPSFAGPIPLPQAGEGIAGESKTRVGDIMGVRETAGHLLGAFAEHARAFVEVQNGCDHRCTFCVIPFGRGNSRSVPAEIVIERVARLADKGFNEVVLTGVDVTAWGAEWGLRLGDLVQRILREVPALPRLRLSSLDAVEIDGALFEAIAGEARLMPHLHLSLQAGDDMVLTRMKRRHRRADALHFVAALKARRDVAIGADIIAGFPTEDEAMFEGTLALIADCDIVHAHVFPYSVREGTPAARMPQVPVATRRERASRLRAAAAERRAAWLGGQVGGRQSVLVEDAAGFGHGEGFAPVRIDGGATRGSIVTGQVVAQENGELRMVA